jgi:mannitol/fructose-specific phosphotransferase system IIA component (Ntr-type)
LTGSNGVRLTDKLTPAMVFLDPEVPTREDLFVLYGRHFAGAGAVADADDVILRLSEREEILSTGIGGGVAVPHAQIRGLGGLVMAASTHPDGLVYPALDTEPVRLVFCLLGDTDTAAEHLAGLARLARIARRGDAVERLVGAASPEEFIDTLGRLESS